MEGTCLPPGPSFTGYAVVTIISDIIVTLLPIPVLLRLNVKIEKKLGLIVVFILGVFTTICSVMRYTQIERIQFGDGNSTMLVLWGTIEFNVGVSIPHSQHFSKNCMLTTTSQNIVSSLPFLAPVFLRKAKGYRSKNGASYGNTGSRNFGKSGDRYKLSSLGNKPEPFATANERGNSEENILSTCPNNSIIKSVTYTVQIDDDDDSTKSTRKDPSSGVAM